MRVCFRAATLFVLLVPAALAGEPAVVGVFVFPDVSVGAAQHAALADSIPDDRRIRLGGFSDLWRSPEDAAGEFWIVTDRGPNGEIEIDGRSRRTFPVPEFTPLMLRVRTEPGGTLKLVETVAVVGRSGAAVGGFPNLAGYDSEAFDFRGEMVLGYQIDGIDSEGLIRTADGEFWLAEEYRPSILRLDPSGRTLKRFIPAGQTLAAADCDVADVLPAIYARRRDNRGFEGLALSPDGRTIYAPMQSPLENLDAAMAKTSRNCRILAFDIEAERPVAEYVYRFEAADQFEPGAAPGDVKIGAAAMIGPQRMLVLERTDAVARVYAVDLSAGDNLLETEWHDATGADAVEALDDDLAAAGIRVLPKRLVVDLSLLDGVPEKIEGLAVVDARHIAIVNDNDFGFDDFDADGNANDNGRRSKLLIIRLPEPLW